jgi:hypothetical protein
MLISPKRLFLIATVATLLFAFSSDPAPSAVESFAQATGVTDPFSLVCQIIGVQDRTNGTTLTLIDATQAQAKAFLPRALGVAPSIGQVVRLTLAPSDRAGFYFVEDLAYI